MNVIKRLSKCIREFKMDTILTPLFIALEVVFECFLPFVTSELVDQMYAKELSVIVKLGIILVVMAIASFACGTLSGMFCAKASAGFARNLRSDLFNNVQTFSFSNIDKFSMSSLVTRLTTDVTNVQMAFMMIIRVAIRSPLMLVFSMVMAFSINWKLALIFVGIIPVIGTVLCLGVFYVHPIFDRIFHKYDAMNESIQENVKGMRVVKAYVREDYEKQKFNERSDDVKNDFTRAEKIIALNSPVMMGAMYVAITLVSIISAILIIKGYKGTTTLVDGTLNYGWGEVSTGDLSAMITYGVQMLMSLMMLMMILVMIVIARASAQRVCEVLDEESDLKNNDKAYTDLKDGSIEFKNVSFKYSEKAEKNALSNINLKIDSGMTVGIIGGTGSAKSTLVQLISRLYDATEGEVIVAGHNVKDYDLTTLRNQVAQVLQKNVLFSGTIKENLKWGDLNASDEEVVHAAKLAQADDFIQSFPLKYDHHIEQGGTNVSGGQKQRLCIARSLLKKPKILILDDSTSAVDTKTDALIRKAFKEYIPDTTKIIIAQRIASVEEADLILVMDKGEIAAQGTHEQLIKSSDIYREVYQSQNKVNSNDGGEQNA